MHFPDCFSDIFTACRRSCDKIMFSYVSVHQLVSLSTGGSHVTITHDAYDLNVLGLLPPPGHQTYGSYSHPPPTSVQLRHETPPTPACTPDITHGASQSQPPASQIWQPSLETCFKLVHLSHLPVLTSGGDTKACMVGMVESSLFSSLFIFD